MWKWQRAQNEPCSVVITTRIWDQWRHSGVSKRENPPCFWLHLLMLCTSSRYIIAQWFQVVWHDDESENIHLRLYTSWFRSVCFRSFRLHFPFTSIFRCAVSLSLLELCGCCLLHCSRRMLFIKGKNTWWGGSLEVGGSCSTDCFFTSTESLNLDFIFCGVGNWSLSEQASIWIISLLLTRFT
jgi:hypothetical protein